MWRSAEKEWWGSGDFWLGSLVIRNINCLLTNHQASIDVTAKETTSKSLLMAEWNMGRNMSDTSFSMQTMCVLSSRWGRQLHTQSWQTERRRSGKTRGRQTGWRRWLLVCHCKQHYIIIKHIEFPAVFQACWLAATFLIQQVQSTEAV